MHVGFLIRTPNYSLKRTAAGRLRWTVMYRGSGRLAQALGVGNERHMNFQRIPLLTLLLLTGCGTDPGDVTLLERTNVQEAVAPGSPFSSAQPMLAKLGYECELSSGSFSTESGQTRSAPQFLWCAKGKTAGFACSVKTQVIVVPQGTNVANVHFSSGNVCL